MLSLFLTIAISVAAPLKVLVIDSGIDPSYSNKLCSEGHKSFVKDIDGNDVPWNQDITIKHGTSVSGIIEKYAGEADYCIVHYKVFYKTAEEIRKLYIPGNIDNTLKLLNLTIENNPLKTFIEAFTEALNHDFDFINVSATGQTYSNQEYELIVKLLNKGTIITVSAGNYASNLDVRCDSYPACYDKRLVVVGSLDKNGQLFKTTNYSFLMSNFVYVKADDDSWKVSDTDLVGTSQSTAYVTSQLIKTLDKRLRNIQSMSKSDVQTIQKAILSSTDTDEQIKALAEKYIKHVPSEIKLAGEIVIPLYKTYSSGMLVIEKKF